MANQPNADMSKQVAAHSKAEDIDVARLRALSMQERGRMLISACEAAALIYRSRLAAGLPGMQRDPWPESTWEFLRKHAARARNKSAH